MSLASIMSAVICWFCALIFAAIAFWAFKRKDPMHFWSGSTVRPEEISDIPSYNRANGLMWAIYAGCMFATGILSLFSIIASAVMITILCVPGSAVLIFVYSRIYNKYKNTSFTSGTANSAADKPKTGSDRILTSVIIVISAIILMAVVMLFLYGEKEPDVIIHNDRIQIKSMYGLNIYFSEINDIELIEKSMSEIGIGRRNNGYGGFGGTLKGNFKSEDIGESLLFVQAYSSPTIRIERTDKKDVYISFRDSAETERLYNELVFNILQR